jgi:phage tail-like protein
MPRSAWLDPIEAYRFDVEIEGIIVGGFSEVSGIQSELKLYSYREGGENGFVHYFPDSAEQARLVLKRGMIYSDALWSWYREVVGGLLRRRTVYVLMVDRDGDVAFIWGFTNAFPVKWTGPDLNASTSAIAVESVELVYQEILKSPWL